MRLSEHDREQVTEVARFASNQNHDRDPAWWRHLNYVHLADGWACGTDAYRMDMREVDTLAERMVDPVTFTALPSCIDVWTATRTTRTKGPTSHADLDVAGVLAVLKGADKPGRDEWPRFCLGCHLTGNVPSFGHWAVCRCEKVPLLDTRWLRDALGAADEPSVRLTWDARRLSVRYSEPEHHHILMAVRR